MTRHLVARNSDGLSSKEETISYDSPILLRDFPPPQIYCSGPSDDLGGAAVTVEGGTIANNIALEHGGALVAWGVPTQVFVRGGTFMNNMAQ